MIAGLARPRVATRRDRLVAAHIFDTVLALQLLLGTTGFGRNALFYSLVFLHALAAIAGFGSIGFAGTYAANAYLPDDRLQDETPGTVDMATGRADEASGTVYEVSGTVYETATSHVEDVPGGVEAEDVPGAAEEVVVVEEAVVAEDVVQAGRPTSSASVERDGETEELRRYFAHPARLWGLLLLVPFLGAGALAAQPNGKGFDQPWVFGALAVWLAATLVAGSLVVPSLHQMQVVLLRSDNPEASSAARSSLAVRFARAGRIASRSAAFCDILFLVALALMIFRP
ncbi:MAG TPA: hypothetical protein VMS00_13630 [Acidimicrobiales bacterium]|nr:hypothetical protein [Acidimicrobiales bacterium]